MYVCLYVPYVVMHDHTGTINEVYEVLFYSLLFFIPFDWIGLGWLLLIPYTPRPMMRDGLTPLAFHLFDRVIEEEVDQDSVDSEVESRLGIDQVGVGRFFCGHVVIFVVVDLLRWRIALARFRMAAFDLLPDEFDTPDTDSSDLNLPCRSAFDGLQSSDVAL